MLKKMFLILAVILIATSIFAQMPPSFVKRLRQVNQTRWLKLGANDAGYQPPQYAYSALYYTFDTFTNIAGKIIDSSINGTNVGTPYLYAHFPASGTTSAYVSVSGVPEASITVNDSESLQNSTQITLSCWLYLTNRTTSAPVISRGKSPGTPWSYALAFDNSTAGALRWLISIGGALKIVTSPELPTNQWVHIAGVYDGTNSKLYTNAVSVGTPYTGGGSIDLVTTNTYVGRYSDTTYSYPFAIDNIYFVGGASWSAVDCTNDYQATKGLHGL